MRQRAIRTLLVILVWTLVVCYPRPWDLPVSVYRVFRPTVDPSAVAVLADEITVDDPVQIERFVLQRIPYQYDWVTYGRPWYFPTPAEVMARGTGDCKSRFVVLASVLELKEIPYQQRFSLAHFWIEYEGKVDSEIEAPDLALLTRDEAGSLRISRPRTDWIELGRTMRQAGWDAMPSMRKWLLVSGWVAGLIWFVAGFRRRGVVWKVM